MIRQALRLSEMAPVLVFALAAAFIGASLALNNDPGNPVLWQTFMTLLPVLREPVYLADSIPGVGYGLAFAGFVALALAGCWLLASRRTLALPRFLYLHAAFLALVYSMGQSRVFQAAGNADAFGSTSPLDWSLNLQAFPSYGYVLFAVVALSCAGCHLLLIKRILARAAIQRDIETRLGASIQQFA